MNTIRTQTLPIQDARIVTRAAPELRRSGTKKVAVVHWLIRSRTQVSNASHCAAEFGITAAIGIAHLDLLLDRIQAGEHVPDLGIART
jgi:hypothetical protein